MDAAPAPAPERPRGPFVLGVLNIVFGSIGILCNCYSGVNAGAMGAADSMMQQAQAQVDAKRAADIAGFEQRLADAADDDEKKEVRKEYDRWIEQNPQIDFSGMYAWARKPAFLIPTIGDAVLSLLLNVVAIVAGIGLLRYRPWSRRLAMWTAAGKLALIAVSSILMVTLVVPAFSDGMQEMMTKMEEMQKSMPNAPRTPMPMGESIGAIYKVMGSVGVVFGAVLTSVYPIVVLCMLGSHRGRRAFEPS